MDHNTFTSEEQIRIKKNVIYAKLSLVRFEQEDHFVLFVPSLDLSAYGPTIEAAEEMCRVVIDEFFEAFSIKELVTELEKLGWQKDKLRTKNYSPLYVDIKGKLQGIDYEMLDSLEKEYEVV